MVPNRDPIREGFITLTSYLYGLTHFFAPPHPMGGALYDTSAILQIISELSYDCPDRDIICWLKNLRLAGI